MNKHYLVINDNGDAFRVAPTDDTYSDISTLVDGWVECVGLPGGVDAWVNEEGLLRNPQDFAVNLVGTKIVRDWTGHDHTLVGPVVFASSDNQGATHPCDERFILHEMQDGLLLMGDLTDIDSPLRTKWLTRKDGHDYFGTAPVWTVADCADRMAESRRIYMEARA